MIKIWNYAAKRLPMEQSDFPRVVLGGGAAAPPSTPSLLTTHFHHPPSQLPIEKSQFSIPPTENLSDLPRKGLVNGKSCHPSLQNPVPKPFRGVALKKCRTKQTWPYFKTDIFGSPSVPKPSSCYHFSVSLENIDKMCKSGIGETRLCQESRQARFPCRNELLINCTTTIMLSLLHISS